MDDTHLIEADLVVDDENLLIETEIQDVDDIDVDKDVEEDFVATPVHFEALEKQYNTTCVKKKHKEIWKEVEVQVPKPPSWTPENMIEDIDVVKQTNAS
ncbi:hypothetical protein Tco_0073384 [Tanacetum coccineum]